MDYQLFSLWDAFRMREIWKLNTCMKDSKALCDISAYVMLSKYGKLKCAIFKEDTKMFTLKLNGKTSWLV